MFGKCDEFFFFPEFLVHSAVFFVAINQLFKIQPGSKQKIEDFESINQSNRPPITTKFDRDKSNGNIYG